MKREITKAYIYRFDNLINGKWYIGARWNYKGTPQEDTNYNSSSTNPEFWRALRNGELRKTILTEFNKSHLPVTVIHEGSSLVITDVVTLSLWVEDQLIKSGWRIYGKRSSYNLRSQFMSNVGFNFTDPEKLSKAQKERWDEEERERMRRISLGENNSFYGKTHSDESKSVISEKIKDKWNDPNYRRKVSEAHKGKVFVQKDGVTKYIKKEELDSYLAEGYQRGRANECRNRRRPADIGSRISSAKKGRRIKVNKAEWLLPDGSKCIMALSPARRYHPEWILIKMITPDQSV